jgi:hypothetical protein
MKMKLEALDILVSGNLLFYYSAKPSVAPIAPHAELLIRIPLMSTNINFWPDIIYTTNGGKLLNLLQVVEAYGVGSRRGSHIFYMTCS